MDIKANSKHMELKGAAIMVVWVLKSEGISFLNDGSTLKILVGQMGEAILENRFDYSGGGGTFVIADPFSSTSSILVIAGGGGGATSG